MALQTENDVADTSYHFPAVHQPSEPIITFAVQTTPCRERATALRVVEKLTRSPCANNMPPNQSSIAGEIKVSEQDLRGRESDNRLNIFA